MALMRRLVVRGRKPEICVPRRPTSSASPLLRASPTTVTTLRNGIRVATEMVPTSTSTVGVFIDAGSAYETSETNGVAHFLEHMAFKGTRTRSQEDIERAVEDMGAQLNAYTSREHTVYVGKSFRDDVPRMVELLADILRNSRLDPAAIERERSVILTEKEVVEENLEEVTFDYLHATAFQGTPLARTILGEERNIREIKREDLVDYITTHYTGQRMAIVATGAVQHDQVVELAEQHFGDMPATSEFNFETLADVPFTGSEIRVRDDTLPFVHGAVAFRSVSWAEADYIPFMVLQAIIGSYDRACAGGNALASRLAEVAEDQNLAQSYTTFHTCYNRCGLFGVYFVSPYQRVDEMAAEVMHEITLARNVSEAELERAKNRVKAAYLMQLDGTSAICEDIGRQLITLGRRMAPSEVFLRVDAVTTADLNRIAWDHFKDVDPAVTAIGPLKHFPDYALWRTRTNEFAL